MFRLLLAAIISPMQKIQKEINKYNSDRRSQISDQYFSIEKLVFLH